MVKKKALQVSPFVRYDKFDFLGVSWLFLCLGTEECGWAYHLNEGVVIAMVSSDFSSELKRGSYGLLKKLFLGAYFCDTKEFGESEGTYPPISKGSKNNGVKKSPTSIAICEI